jgi:DNA-binding NarL/FixJ family response regulator
MRVIALSNEFAHPGPAATEGLRVQLVDGPRAFAEALATLLRAHDGIASVSIATAAGEAQLMLAATSFDVLLVDHMLGDDDVTELIAAVGSEWPDLPVVVLSESDDVDTILELLLAGARGWIDVGTTADDMVRALHVVVSGGLWLPPALLQAALHALTSGQAGARSPRSFVDRLTAREREVLDHLASGHSRTEIAKAMSVSPNTVRTHIQNVLKKAEVHSTPAALAKARRAIHHSPITR